MPLPLFSLVGFSVWTAFIMAVGVGTHRWSHILFGSARLSDFPGDMPHGPDRYRRIVRAHANCIENLPIFTALVMTASALDYRSELFDALCLAVILARVTQTTIHIASGTDRAIAFRFTFFTVQLCAFFAMAALIVASAEWR